MKVGFDISQLAHVGGVTTYTKNLTTELEKFSDLEMIYFYSSLRRPYKGKLKPVKEFKLPPTLFEILFNKIRNVPIEKFVGSVDIFHSSDWVQPPSKSKKVTTYHDVIPLKFPQWSHPKIVAVHKRRLELVEREVDLVIAVSETTKQDLLAISKIPEDRITVIYEGVGKEFKVISEKDVEAFRKKYHLPEKFVLAVGGVGERKNLGRIKEVAKDFPLIISGETIPYVSDVELPLLYNAATVLMYTTLYEGFGLPIVEAMACGTTVLTSNSGAHREIAGDAALFADPENINDMRIELKKLMESNELRKDLKEKGIKRAAQFSWEKTAKETKVAYDSLMGN
jgi:glycosyltransferase involved in cell wall biosynthesis